MIVCSLPTATRAGGLSYGQPPTALWATSTRCRPDAVERLQQMEMACDAVRTVRRAKQDRLTLRESDVARQVLKFRNTAPVLGHCSLLYARSRTCAVHSFVVRVHSYSIAAELPVTANKLPSPASSQPLQCAAAAAHHSTLTVVQQSGPYSARTLSFQPLFPPSGFANHADQYA